MRNLFAVIVLTLGLAWLNAKGAESPKDAGAAARADLPALVSITTVRLTDCILDDDECEDQRLIDDAHGLRRNEIPERAMASGFVISSDGQVLTAAHAVRGVSLATVRLSDGRRLEARVLGLDRSSDVALLQLPVRDLPTMRLGDSDSLMSGQRVFALGAPFGLFDTVTAGVVSAVHRSVPGVGMNMIQTDVPINAGSSGGPLLDESGGVVGLNTVVYSLTGGFMGVSLAIPIDDAMAVVRALRRDGHVVRGQIGASVQALTPELAEAFGSPVTEGTLVTHVAANGHAERAGLRSGDILLALAGGPRLDYAEMRRRIESTSPGSEVSVTLWREGHLYSLKLPVVEAPSDRPPSRPAAAPQRGHPDAHLGMTFGEMSDARRRALKLDSGLPVLRVTGAAMQAGIEQDDIVVAIGHSPIFCADDFDRLLREVPVGRPVAVLVQRHAVLRFLTVLSSD